MPTIRCRERMRNERRFRDLRRRQGRVTRAKGLATRMGMPLEETRIRRSGNDELISYRDNMHQGSTVTFRVKSAERKARDVTRRVNDGKGSMVEEFE